MFLIGTSYCHPYDPKDEKLISVLPHEGTFEGFYPPEVDNVPNGSSHTPPTPPTWKTSTRIQLNGLDTKIPTDTKDREHTRKYIPSITT
jgi:hypothetical protein